MKYTSTTVNDACKLVGIDCSEFHRNNWEEVYKKNGIASLLNDRQKGGKHKMTPETMTSLEQKEFLEMPLPVEIIEDKIMKNLSIQDLENLIEVGNNRLKDCSHRVIKKRPYSKSPLSIMFLIY